MRAVRVPGFGDPTELVELPVPPPRPGQTLIRMAAGAVSHIDLDVMAGNFGILPRPPYTPGTEGSGVVVAGDMAPGTTVRIRGEGVGLRIDGTWAEYACVPTAAVFKVPPTSDPILAACFVSPAGTALGTVRDVVGVCPGERVLVSGAAGAVGSLALQLAREAGADTVAVVGRSSKIDSVPGGGRVVLPADIPDAAAEGLFDAMIDTVGGDVLQAGLSAIRPGGRVGLIGYTAGAEVLLDLRRFLLADVSLLPVNMLHRMPQVSEDLVGLLGRLTAGDLVLPTTTWGMSDAGAAVGAVLMGDVFGKAAILLHSPGVPVWPRLRT